MVEVPSHRLPPQSLEGEMSVLGGVLLDNEALNKALEILRPEDFYRDSHRKIFASLIELSDRNEPADLVTLTAALQKRGELEGVGGTGYLATLVDYVPTAANIIYYCRLVKEKALARHLIQVSTEIATRGYDGGEIEQILDWAEKSIFEITGMKARPSCFSTREIMKDTFKTIEKLFERKELVTGIPTGFKDLDVMTAGLQGGDLLIIAGRPSMGKTALCLNLVEHAAVHASTPTPTLVFSLEMSKEQLVQRMLCSISRVDASRLRTGHLGESDWPKLTNGAGLLSDAPIYIDDTPAISILELRAKARRLKAEKNIGLIIIDYLQLMQGHNAESRQQEISEISRSLKALAKELNVPVMALSQLNRSLENRTDKRPIMADLRECVTGDTLVALADGRRLAIKELVGQNPRVVALSPEGRLVEADCEKIWCVGRKPVFNVRLASGRVIRATGKHRLLGAQGWCRVESLGVGDRLAIAREMPEPAAVERWPDLRVALLGSLIGDGSYLKGQPLRFSTGCEECSSLVKEAAEKEFGATVKRYVGKGNWHQLLISGNGNRWHPAGVNRWLRELGIFGQRSHEKRIPEAAFRLANDQIELLLRHLWATDGTIHTRKSGSKGGNSIHFSTSSSGLAGDVGALLLRLGIVSRTQKVHQQGCRPWYMVHISGMEAQLMFLKKVGAFGQRQVQTGKLLQALVGKKSNTNVDTVPIEVFDHVRLLMKGRGISQRRMTALRGTSYGGTAHFRFSPSRSTLLEYAEILDDDLLRQQALSDLFWDRVTAIEPAGEEEVFDLTVPGPSSWLADGIVSHNSGAIEQDADVIMFVYREAVYCEACKNKEKTCDKGHEKDAELIVGKQRNGPIGTVHLTFLGQFTRFENQARRQDGY